MKRVTEPGSISRPGPATRRSGFGRPENGGLKWAMDPDFPRLMPNFSHGTRASPMSWLRSTRRPGGRSSSTRPWPARNISSRSPRPTATACLVFHDEPGGKGLYHLGWCHGPVGTARLFFLLSGVTGDKSWLDWVRKSANGLLESGIPEQEAPGFWNNAGICCGLAGVGEVVLPGPLQRARRQDVCRFLEARRVAAFVHSDYRRRADVPLQAEHRTRPDYRFAQTGYMQGAAGIGDISHPVGGARQGA